MSDKLKLYKLNYSGAEINERLEKVDANFEKIAENLAAINENTAADAEFKAEVANTYAKKSDMPNMEDYALKSELPVMPDLTDYALKSELPVMPDLTDYALKSDIPEGQDLSAYATKAEIEAAGYLTEHQDLSNYALKSDIPEAQDLSVYATKAEVEAVNTKIDTVLANAPEELDTLKEIADLLETKQDAASVVEALSSKANVEDVYTKDEIDNKGFITELPEIPTVPTNVSAFENDANYLTEHQSLENYATKQYVDDKVAEVATNGEINLDAYATKEYVTEQGFLTQHQDLSNYVTTEALEQAGYITSEDIPTIPSIEGLATVASVDAVNDRIDTILANAPEELDTLKEIADLLETKQDAADVVEALESKANANDVEQSFANINSVLDEKADVEALEEYVLKAELPEMPDLTDYALKSELPVMPDLTGYATKEEVTAVDTKIDTVLAEAPEQLDTLKEIADLLETKQDAAAVVEALASKANVEDLPNMSLYATKAEIEEAGYLTAHQDLSAYATKAEIPSLEGYATESYVNEELETKANVNDIPDVSNFITPQILDAKLGDFVTEGSEEHWTMNGVDYEEDPTYEVSNAFDYIHDAESWQQSYENGGLALYYANNPFEDLWSEEFGRVANITDHVCEFVSYADENGETEYATGKVQELVNNPWNEEITYIKVKVIENSVEGFVGNEYYLDKNAEVGETLYQLYTDDALTQGTGIYVKITSETVPGFTQSWEGAINAPGAMYPWIVPHFENDETDANAKIIFRYEGLDDVYPWGDRVFGNGNDHKIWGCASIPGKLGNEFLLTNGETSFDINKFQMVLEHQGVTHYPAVEATEYTVKEYIDMKFQQLFEMINA